jgi:hypothetical protein
MRLIGLWVVGATLARLWAGLAGRDLLQGCGIGA